MQRRVLLRLHALAQGGHSGDAGVFKTRNNEIIEILPDGRSKVRFVPTSAQATPGAITRLCEAYRRGGEDERIPALLVIANFVFDLLCIHPFRDGNGRVSRLATTFLLQAHGFQVARYISLERLGEGRKEEYYASLAAGSTGWHEDKHDPLPWWNHFLGVLSQAYRDFESQVESMGARPVKGEMVRRAVLAQIGPFSLGDLAPQLPSVS